MLARDLCQPRAELCVLQQSWQQDPEGFQSIVERLQVAGNHDQIPILLEGFQRDGQSYLVHKYIQGLSLKEALARQERFDPTQIRHLLVDALLALQWIHHHGLILGNLSLTSWRYTDTKTAALNLVNFRAACLPDHSPPRCAHAAYAAPEQLQGKSSYASDIFSLGMSCLYLLAGEESLDILERGPFEMDDHHLREILVDMVCPDETYRFSSVESILSAMQEKGLVNRRRLPKYNDVAIVQPTATLIELSDSSVNSLKVAAIAPRPVSSNLILMTVPSASLSVSSYQDDTIYQWDLHRGIPLEMCRVTGHIKALALTTDGQLMAFGGSNRTVHLRSTQVSQPEEIIVCRQGVTALAFSPDSAHLAIGDADGRVTTWNLRLKQIDNQLISHRSGITAMAYHPQSPLIATSSLDCTIKLWHCQNGVLVRTLQNHTKAPKTLAFSPDGTVLASGGDDNQIILWDVKTWQPHHRIPGHSWSVSTLAFTSSSRVCVSGSWDHTVKLWDVATGKAIATLAGHADRILAVETLFSDQVVSVSCDNTMRLWNERGLGMRIE